jgi:threonine synthase
VPYNWERILYFVSNKDSKAVTEIMEQFYKTGSASMPSEWMPKLRAVLSTASVNQAEMRQSIKQAYATHKYVMEPHTAIGVEAYRKVVPSAASNPRAVVCLATATPAKFVETMQDVLGFKPELPAPYTKLYSATQHSTPMARGDNWEAMLRKEIQSITARRKAADAPK